MSETAEQIITCLAAGVVSAIGIAAWMYHIGRVARKPKSQYLRWAWIGAIVGFFAGIVFYIIMLELNLT
jgi:preprotein translocase subunit Sss1